METMNLKDIQQALGIGRRLAERYVRESGLVLPRPKRGPYLVPRKAFLTWMEGARR